MKGRYMLAVGLLLMTLLAVALQCEECDHPNRRNSRRQRRLRNMRLHSSPVRQNKTTASPTTSKSAVLIERTEKESGMTFIQPWTVDPNNPYGYRTEDAADTSKPEQPQDLDDSSYSTADAIPSPTLSTHQWHTRLRSKQARLFRIQMQILRKLGLRRQPNITSPSIPSDLPIIEHYDPSDYDEYDIFDDQEDVMERFQFIKPSCDFPRRTDVSWNDHSEFRMYFQLNSNLNHPDTRVTSAYLRIYKRPVSECNCQNNNRSPGQRLERSRRSRNNRRLHTYEDQIYDEYEDTERVRISVFKYNKPVRRGRKERKKLLDSIMVERSAEGWQKLDIKPAVNAWIKSPTNNFGLVIQVEDMLENVINATSMFDNYNCTANGTLPFMPLSAAVLESGGSPFLEQNQTTPYLEVLSVEYFYPPNFRTRRDVESSCQLHHKTVSLKELGLNWTSGQEQVKMGYCSGHCPASNLKSQKTCVPLKWENLQVAGPTNSNSASLTLIPRFSASSCACRILKPKLDRRGRSS